MPRSYYGGRNYIDPSEMQQSAGGNPWYNPMRERPDWAAGIRSTLNQIGAIREQRKQEAEEKRRWEIESAREEQRTRAALRADELQAQRSQLEIDKILKQAPPSKIDRLAVKKMIRSSMPPDQAQAFEDTIDSLSDDQVYGLYKFYYEKTLIPEEPKEPRAPSAFAEKKAALDAALKRGDISLTEYKEGLYDINQPKPEADIDLSKTATPRQANEAFIRDRRKSLPADPRGKGGELRVAKDNLRETGSVGTTTEGFRYDMPDTYNISNKNIEDGVPNKKDPEIKEKYDTMLRLFLEEDGILATYPTLNEFMRSGAPILKDKSFDINIIKDWYYIYGK